jgi:peptidase C39-like protein
VIAAAAALIPAAHAQAPKGAVHLLDVPYLPQSERLCGGAAVAMVMRYWGAVGVYAETFAPLVDRSAGGIRGEDLLGALHAHSWQASSFRGDATLLQTHLAAGRPLIALIQDRPGQFHYVVLVGWSNGRVIVHDPARAPFRVFDEKRFSDAWALSGYWTLLATPGTAPADGVGRPAVPPIAAPPEASACGALVDEGVRLAGTEDLEGARRLFEIAAGECPGSAAPWREMAGLHALHSEWRHAAADARRAIVREPGDQHAWRILATSLFLQDDQDGALEAWNHVGEPIVDLVSVKGLERTRYAVAARGMALHPQALLTRRALQAARRRLAELPAAQTTRVTYRPGVDGRAQVEAVVIERPLLPTGLMPLVAAAVPAIIDRELALGVASPSGGGELWTVKWRWWAHRPRVDLAFDSPAPFGGTWGVQAFDDRQTYANGPSETREARRGAAFHVADWTSTGMRWEAEAGIDRWRGAGRSAALALSVEQRLAGDRGTVVARAGTWAGGVRTWTLGLSGEWRSVVPNEGDVWIARVGIDAAGETAPLALWPGASTGPARGVLLRAHPLLDDGIIRDGVFGRSLAHGGAEWRRWFQPRTRLVSLAPAIFVDAARAGRGRDAFDRRLHVDMGGGVRLAIPGAGVVRIDLARGLRDRSMALSAGWTK